MSDPQDAARSGMYASKDIETRVYAELIGLCRGVLADAHVSDREIVALHDWLRTNGSHLPEWPGKLLVRHVTDILRDGIIEEDERSDLVQFLEAAVGRDPAGMFDAPTSLPLDSPPPHILYEFKSFCLTGTFIFGPRQAVADAIMEWGGVITETPSKADYLVIGTTITPAWKHSTHGRKIERAVALQESGHPIRIVAESHWSTTLC